jgi:ATP/maltotriose-dependent transcriptional regulator MalT
VGWRALAAALGPTPVPEAIPRCEELQALVRESPVALASTLNPLALLHAMAGDFELAEELLDEAGEILRELGGLGSGVSHLEAFVRLLLDQPARAEERLRTDMETLSAMGSRSALATTTALLAHAVYALGRATDAGELCATAREYAAPDDTVTQTVWRSVQAKVLAGDGRCREAEALAREAVALVAPTDLLWHRGDAMLDLAQVLATCMRIEDAELARSEAVELYELKGHGVAAARAQSLPSHQPGGM